MAFILKLVKLLLGDYGPDNCGSFHATTTDERSCDLSPCPGKRDRLLYLKSFFNIN